MSKSSYIYLEKHHHYEEYDQKYLDSII